MHRAGWVLLISGLLGFRVGIVGFPDWQVAVETTQVIAGFVHYPAGNPFYIYHTKLWTILHQLCAIFLMAGVSEIRLSLILSGVLGMVTFQALAMFVYAFSRDALLAIGAAVLIFFTRVAEQRSLYGLFLLGTENTYGILGLSFCVLAAALLGAGAYRSGAMLVGLAPAVHPTLGVWLGIVVGCAVLWETARPVSPKRAPTLLATAGRWFLAGCCVTAASLAIQYAFIYRQPPAGEPFDTRELAAFVTYWDGHRKPVAITTTAVMLNVAALAMASIWLIAFVKDLPRQAIFLLRAVVISAVIGIALVFVSWLPPERLPTTLLVMMPGRVLNFNALIFAAFVIGLVGNYRPRFWAEVLLLCLLTGLLVSDQSMLWEWFEQKLGARYYFSHVRPLWVIAGTCAALILGAGLSRMPTTRDSHGPAAGHYSYALSLVVLLTAVVCTLGFSRPRSLIFRDRTNDVFWGQVAAGKGLLLTAGDLHLVQLKTRRPVLLDGGGLDGVLYSLEGGAAMRRILSDVYGIDLLNPPDEARGAGRIPPMANRKSWEAYSPAKWREIKRNYGVTQVLTYPDWTLSLPLAAQSRRLLLYDIPD